MMTPARCARITGKTCLQAMIAPRRLMVADAVERLLGDLVERRVAAGDAHADIVVEDVDAAPALAAPPRPSRRAPLPRDVGRKCRALAARLPAMVMVSSADAQIIVDREHFGAFLRKAQHRGAAVAHAGVAAKNEGRLSLSC